MTASNLVKIDVEGNNVGPSQYMVNKAGFTQHAYFHEKLGERANAICHVHTTATMAVCSHKDGLLPTNFYACNFQGQIGYHDFEGVTVRPEEGGKAVTVSVPRAFFTEGPETVSWLQRKGADEFDYGYALTVHKAQGSQWDNVVLFDESYMFREHGARWLYTGVTRAAERLTLVR